MGQTRAFHCTSCDYSAEVSAGDDAGMAVTTTTVLCEDCQALMESPSSICSPDWDRRVESVVARWSLHSTAALEVAWR
jgi:hypothetical protein